MRARKTNAVTAPQPSGHAWVQVRREHPVRRVAVTAFNKTSRAWRVLKAWLVPTMSPEFLAGDVRRQQRPYLIILLGVVYLLKNLHHASSFMTLGETAQMASLSAAMVAVGLAARGRPESVKVDALLLVVLYFSFDMVKILFQKSSMDAEKVGDVIAAFVIFMQLIVAMGTHLGLVLCWFAAVMTVRPLPDLHQIKVSITLIGMQLLVLHAFLQLSELRKHRETSDAQKSAARLRKLEKDRMKLRQERVGLCLGMVLHHLKAPLLLLKSELSVYSDDAELGPEALGALKSRVGQLWSVFSGLETQVAGELGEELDLDGMSQSLNAGYQHALLPQTIDLQPRGQQAAAEAAPRGETEPGDAQAWEEEEEEDENLDCARALRQPQEHGAMAEDVAPEELRPPSERGAEAQDDAPPDQAGPREGEGEEHAGEERAGDEGGGAAGEASFENVLSPRGVRVVFDPLDPKLAISSLAFLFADGPQGDAPGLLSLLPQCRSNFLTWVQGQVNDSLFCMSEGGEAITFQASPDRVALALPSVRVMLQQLLLHPGTFCEASLAFRGLDETGLDGDGGSDPEGEGRVQAIVELSTLSLPCGPGTWS